MHLATRRRNDGTRRRNGRVLITAKVRKEGLLPRRDEDDALVNASRKVWIIRRRVGFSRNIWSVGERDGGRD